MRYQTLSPEDDESYLNAEERKGILHLVQGWIQRGHPEKVSILASLTSLPLIVMNHPGSFFISRIHAQRHRPWCNPVLVCSDCSYRPHNVGYVWRAFSRGVHSFQESFWRRRVAWRRPRPLAGSRDRIQAWRSDPYWPQRLKSNCFFSLRSFCGRWNVNSPVKGQVQVSYTLQPSVPPGA